MNVIEVKELKKYYGRVKAVDGINFNVEKGEIFGFLGPNGAGKTTTIRTMMDFMRPTSGSISILGLDSAKDSVRLKEKVGYLSGHNRLYDKWTGREHIDFVRQTNGKKDIADELIERLNFDPKIKSKNLSSGNRQKLGIIMAFMLEPEVLILDEPTTGLDPLLQNTVYGLLHEVTRRGATVFVSSHNLAEVDKMCDRVGIIKNGKMVAIESVQSLKDKRLHRAEVCFESNFNNNDFRAEGISIVKKVDHGLVLNITGDVNPLIKTLSKYPLKSLLIEHASLDEIFLEFYEKN